MTTRFARRVCFFSLRFQALFYWIVVVVAITCSGERAYPEGCTQRDASYYDYEHLDWPPQFCQPLLKSASDYLLTRRLGTGKFSDVFEAMTQQQADEEEEIYVVLKCLKPVAERKIRRELLVLHRCADLVHLARLEGLVLQQHQQELPPGSASTTTCLVLQHAGRNSQWLCHPASSNNNNSSTKSHSPDTQEEAYLSDYEIRYFMCHLLIALDDLHRAGIMHRDTKPRNVLINRSVAGAGVAADPSVSSVEGLSPLMLIDLGLADFYHPGCSYNVRVASRHYKAPELLTALECYDSAVDLWGVGCMLAGLLLRREPLFRGRDNTDQLGKIIHVLGVADLLQFLRKYNIPVTSELEREILHHSATQTLYQSKRQALLAFVSTAPSSSSTVSEDHQTTREQATQHVIPEDGLELVEHLLVYDPDERWTAKQALEHSFFDVVRTRVQTEVEQERQKIKLMRQQRQQSP